MKRKTFNRRMVIKMLRIEFRIDTQRAVAILDAQTPQDRESLYTRARDRGLLQKDDTARAVAFNHFSSQYPSTRTFRR
jgi:hypothetical protein